MINFSSVDKKTDEGYLDYYIKYIGSIPLFKDNKNA